jgi:2-dehydro-3-deoxygluconokinase
MSGAGLITLGETMGLITQQGVGHVHNGEAMRFGMGGSESNVAIGVRRLGVPATWIGRVGNDPPGRLIQRELRAEGVEMVAIEDPAATGLMIRWRPAAGRGHVVYHRRESAGSHLRADDVPEDLIARAGVLHGTGITLALGPGPAGALTRAIAVAREAGATVSVDINYRRAQWSEAEAAAAVTAVLRDCDVVFAGLDEARILTGFVDPSQAASALESLGPRQVLITLGPRGCLARIDGTPFEVPAPPATVVDTVGAGDAFVAGYLAELIAGEPPAQRLATAVSAGAAAVSAPGDWEGRPDRTALERYGTDEPVIR